MQPDKQVRSTCNVGPSPKEGVKGSCPTLLRTQDKEGGKTRAGLVGRPYRTMTLVITWRLDRGPGEGVGERGMWIKMREAEGGGGRGREGEGREEGEGGRGGRKGGQREGENEAKR